MVSEIIGLLISIGAFLFILFGHLMRSPTPQTEEQKKKLKDFLDALKKDMQTDEDDDEEEEFQPLIKMPKVPPPPPPPVPQKLPVPVAPKVIAKKPIVIAELEAPQKPLIHSLREMVLMREILDTPRAYRPWNIRHF